MARAFADDLRCRILLAYERGGVSQRELAERFGVSRDYVKKIRKQQVQHGQRERVPQSRYGPVSRVTAAVEEQVRAELRRQPDLTLWELQLGLQNHLGVSLSKSLVWLCLQRWGLRRKKSRSIRKNRTRKKPASNGKRGGNK